MLQENPETARLTINDWIANKTEDLIQDTLPAGALDSNTVLVLVNTIYFKVPEAVPPVTPAAAQAGVCVSDPLKIRLSLC